MDINQHTLIQKYIQSNLFGKQLGMHFNIVNAGLVEYTLTITNHHLATPNAVHGGVISALIDAALGVSALSSVCEENKVVSTIEYKTNFLAPALLNDTLVALGKVEQKGKRILIVSCDVFCTNRQNKLIAKALGTFNCYDAVKAGY
jgi:uncharacterized protein (TIGR00369 family)